MPSCQASQEELIKTDLLGEQYISKLVKTEIMQIIYAGKIQIELWINSNIKKNKNPLGW